MLMFSGCVPMGAYNVQTGDPALQGQVHSAPSGVSRTAEKLPLPRMEKFPLKVAGLSSYPREKRNMWKQYFHTSGAYPTLNPGFAIASPEMNNASSGRTMIFIWNYDAEGQASITDWNSKNPMTAELVYETYYGARMKTTNKRDLYSGSDQTMKILKEDGLIMDNLTFIDLLNKLDRDRAKINELYELFLESE